MSNSELVIPYSYALLADAHQQINPNHYLAFQTAVEEFDRQAVSNFTTTESEKYPGTSFSRTTINITPDLVGKIGSQINGGKKAVDGVETDQEKSPNEEIIHYITFQAINFGDADHALNSADITFDRYMKGIGWVASNLASGQKPATVTVTALGDPQGFGGSISRQYQELVGKGYQATGSMYADYISDIIDPQKANQKIILHGVSRGALTALETFNHLPEALKEKSQVLLDNPAGMHRRGIPVISGLRAIQAALMLVAEGAIGHRNDLTVKVLLQHEPHFLEKLSEVTGIPIERKGILEVLRNAFPHIKNVTFQNSFTLEPSSEDKSSIQHHTKNQHRIYQRPALKDPLTFDPRWLLQAVFKKIHPLQTESGKYTNKRLLIKENGDSLIVVHQGSHFYSSSQPFDRWNNALTTCAKAVSN